MIQWGQKVFAQQYSFLEHSLAPREEYPEQHNSKVQKQNRKQKNIQKNIAQSKISFAMKHTNAPKGLESSIPLRDLLGGAPVIWREKSDSWEGPFPFVHIDGETVVVHLPHGRKLFRSTVVKPTNDSIMNGNSSILSENGNLSEREILALLGTANIRIATKNETSQFQESRAKERKGLMDNKTFKVVKRNSIPKGTRIDGSRFVDSFKTVDNETFPKSRLIAQNYMDVESSKISTRSPTILRCSQRIICCTAAAHPKHKSYNRHMPQAYVQSQSTP